MCNAAAKPTNRQNMTCLVQYLFMNKFDISTFFHCPKVAKKLQVNNEATSAESLCHDQQQRPCDCTHWFHCLLWASVYFHFMLCTTALINVLFWIMTTSYLGLNESLLVRPSPSLSAVCCWPGQCTWTYSSGKWTGAADSADCSL